MKNRNVRPLYEQLLRPAKALAIGTTVYMGAIFLFSFTYHLYLFTEPRPEAPVTKQSVVSPNPPPKCEDTKEQYCDELGILVPRYGYTTTDYEDDQANDRAQQAQQHSRYDY